MLLCITSCISRSAEKVGEKLEKKGAKRVILNQETDKQTDIEIEGWNTECFIILSSPQEWYNMYRRPHAVLVSVVPELVEEDIKHPGYINRFNKYQKEMANIRNTIFVTRENLIEIEESGDVVFLLSKQVRPTWERYFISIAQVASMRSNCMKRRIGAVLVKNNRVVGIGYNGTSTGTINCCHGGCNRCNSNERQGQKLDDCFCIHAEESVFLEVGSNISYMSELYTTTFPCRLCSRKIVQLKVKKVYYIYEYGEDKEINRLFQENNILVEKLSE